MRDAPKMNVIAPEEGRSPSDALSLRATQVAVLSSQAQKKTKQLLRLRAGEEGIEPPLTVLETAALPLYYSPIGVFATNE